MGCGLPLLATRLSVTGAAHGTGEHRGREEHRDSCIPSQLQGSELRPGELVQELVPGYSSSVPSSVITSFA